MRPVRTDTFPKLTKPLTTTFSPTTSFLYKYDDLSSRKYSPNVTAFWFTWDDVVSSKTTSEFQSLATQSKNQLYCRKVMLLYYPNLTVLTRNMKTPQLLDYRLLTQWPKLSFYLPDRKQGTISTPHLTPTAHKQILNWRATLDNSRCYPNGKKIVYNSIKTSPIGLHQCMPLPHAKAWLIREDIWWFWRVINKHKYSTFIRWKLSSNLCCSMIFI